MATAASFLVDIDGTPLPDDIIDATRGRYINAYERISGLSFSDWIGPGA